MKILRMVDICPERLKIIFQVMTSLPVRDIEELSDFEQGLLYDKAW